MGGIIVLDNRVKVLVEGESLLGEGPLWLADSKEIVWVDIEGKCLLIFSIVTGKKRTLPVGQRIGAVVRAEDGRMVCALENGFYYLNPETESLEPIVDPESHLPGNRFNDGKCDPMGRFWAGTMPIEGEGPVGALYRLDGDGSVHKMVEEIGCSNGLGWSLDGKTMYYIDTSTKRIDRFDYDAVSGNITNRQTVVVIPSEQGYPDGMTVDAEGMIWVAHWDGYCISRFDPSTGECLERIELPVSRITSCCFGGEDMDELYITSARVGLSEEQLLREPLAGSLFVYKAGVKGLLANEFKLKSS